MTIIDDKRSTEASRRIALLFRYGPVDHAELYHIVPDILRLLAEKNEVHYFGLNKLRLEPELFDPRVKFHLWRVRVDRGNHRDKFVKTALWYLLLPWIGLRCRFLRADLIFIDETLPLSGLIVRLFSGRPLVMVVADFFLEVYGEFYPVLRTVSGLIYRFEFWTWRRLAGIVVHAEATKRYLVERGINPARVIVVRNPCETTKYFPEDASAERRKLGFTSSDIVLVHHGILHPNKGLDWIITCLQPVMQEDPRLKFLVVGSGPARESLEQLACQLGIEDRIVFTGWLPGHREVNRCLNAGDIGLVMRVGQFSDHFHTTDTLTHCLACGLPVLAARLDGIAEVVKEGENGILFDPRNAEEFRAKLKRLVDDASLRKRLGDRGIQTAQQVFNPDQIVERLIHGLEAFESAHGKAAMRQ